MGILYIDEETGLQVVDVDNGEVLLETEHHGVLARVVVVLLVGGDCCHTCVDEGNFKDELQEGGLHQVIPREDEDEPAAMAPWSPIFMSLQTPMTTPPASVPFCMCTMLNLPSRNFDTVAEDKVDEHSLIQP